MEKTETMREKTAGRPATGLVWTVLLASFWLAGPAPAAPSGLGAQTSIAHGVGGFVGRMTVSPDHGVVGTPISVEATGLPPNESFDLAWRTVEGSWRVADGSYHGRRYEPSSYLVAHVKSDGSGRLAAHFDAPKDFGFSHDVVLQQNDRLFTQAAFSIDMSIKISPDHGPVGTPIHVDVQGIGWRELENSWLLLYDNNFTGWMSAVSTSGSASFTIPATGRPGEHLLEILHGEFTFPYRNMQQNPEPGRPRTTLPFVVTAGDAVLPPAAAKQRLSKVERLPAAGALTVSPPFAAVGDPLTVEGSGLKPGKTYELSWSSVTGNRVDGGGWQGSTKLAAHDAADASGQVAFHFKTPDDLGGSHILSVADVNATPAKGTAWISPTALPLDIDKGPVGTTFDIHLKGVGWTETGNIYTVVYDNSYIGYACAFNSQGDIQIFLHATGSPGWHFIDLYPAIYKGQETQPNNFLLPQLTFAADHPGEDLPAFHFAFEVTPAHRAEAGPAGSVEPN
jgi:hypothetical protein